MATSSIIENIRVNNPSALKEFIDAMESHAKDNHLRTEDEKTGVITDEKRTLKLINMIKKKKGL